jgi:hypothetical protein
MTNEIRNLNHEIGNAVISFFDFRFLWNSASNSKFEFELKAFRISAFDIRILVYASSFPVTCLPAAEQIYYSS